MILRLCYVKDIAAEEACNVNQFMQSADRVF